jgi:hypothetical protein
MYPLLLIIGALGCIPYMDLARGQWEINAWPLLGISLTGFVCYGLYIYTKKWPIILPHLFISAFFVVIFYVFALLVPFGGPGAAVYNHYSTKRFNELQSAFLQSSSENAIKTISYMVLNYSEGMRCNAAGYLGTMASHLHTLEQTNLFAQYAVPALGKALHDPSGFVRRQAAWAVNESGDMAIAVLPDLLSRVSYNDDTAWFSIQTIGNLGPKAENAIPTLLPLLRFNYPQIGYNGGMVREYAVEALGKISNDPQILKALQQALDDPDPDVREKVKEILQKSEAANHLTKP